MREKGNLMVELDKKTAELTGDRRLSLIGQGDFISGNNVMRSAMNIKHQTQHLTIDNPEFPFLYEGKENLVGEHSSFYKKTDKSYKVMHIVKKYDELLKGKCYIAVYFLYCKEDNSWKLIERKEVENLTENFGFDYKNEFLDNAEVGEIIPEGTVLYTSTSYDEDMNVSIGVNARTLYGMHPAVQDDAVIISKSFAERMVANQVSSKTIPIGDDTLLLNLYGEDAQHYRGLPNIGDVVSNGIIAATRSWKDQRTLSDMRDSSLESINFQSDSVFYGDGVVVDINVYNNKKDLPNHIVNKQLLQYWNDAKWFYTKIYKICKQIINDSRADPSIKVDKEINRWMRLAMNHLDQESVWSFNDNVLKNVMVEILIRKKTPIKIGRKLTGRHGNKTVACTIWPDEDMPYLTEETYTDQYGVVQPKGVKERVEIITNPLAIINRTIPMAVYEPSVTFILDRVRKHMYNEMDNDNDRIDFMFDILKILNPTQAKDMRAIYNDLSSRDKKKFVEDCMGINKDGSLDTSNGLYVKWEAFNSEFNLRDAICKIYQKYGDIITPYNVFTPKPKWGRDIYVTKGAIGYQYILMLKQSGERGFSARSAGAISDESLPEKSHDNKIGRSWRSETPIRFGKIHTCRSKNLINCGNEDVVVLPGLLGA